MSETKDNVLRNIPWMLTNEGNQTVEYVLKNLDTVELLQDVPGYQYGTQFRFLMTILPLVIIEAKKNGLKSSEFTSSHVDKVLDSLEPSSHLFNGEDPFLQISKRYFVEPNIKTDSIEKNVFKFLPAEPNEKQQVFWNFEEYLENNLSLEKATMLLATAYFYKSGGNSRLDGRKPVNSSSALKYIDASKTPPAVEIIPVGETLRKTLLMSIPNEWTKVENENKLPHWADREGKSFNAAVGEISELWLFSWTSNAYYCVWNENKNALLTVGVGGGPDAWSPGLLFEPRNDDKSWQKVHDMRKEIDPLYFYVEDKVSKVPKKKLTYMNLSSEPYYHIARWNSENLSIQLIEKWKNNTDFRIDDIDNLLFLEHATGGTAQSFTIRHSKVVLGWKDELLPSNSNIYIDDIYKSVLSVRGKLVGFFTKEGTMKHLINRRKEVEQAYWGHIQDIIQYITDGKIDIIDANKYAKKAAQKALNSVSSRRNTLHLKNHLQAENALLGMKL